LPTPIVNGKGDSFEKISNFQGLVTLTLDRSYCILSCITHRLYLHAKFHWNRKNFLWTDGHLRLALLGRLWRLDLKIQNMPQQFLRHRYTGMYHANAQYSQPITHYTHRKKHQLLSSGVTCSHMAPIISVSVALS